MKLINSPGWETIVPSKGLVIGDREAVPVDDELALDLLTKHPTLLEVEED